MSSKQIIFDNFPAFWAEYPRKVARGAAFKAYEKALAAVAPEIILAGLRQWKVAHAGDEEKFIPHAATWLNQERWADRSGTATTAPSAEFIDSVSRPRTVTNGGQPLREIVGA